MLVIALLFYIGYVIGYIVVELSDEQLKLLVILIPIALVILILLYTFYPRITGKLWPIS